jgi:hypothetical protein
MKLSTAGAHSRAGAPPRHLWLLTWTVAFALVLFGLAASESLWRFLGYRSSVDDTHALWKFWYEFAMRGHSQTIAIIGASRIHAGISTSEMRRRLPSCRVVQLAQYGGGGPIGVLRALALDERFKGIVICDTLTPFLSKSYWEDQRELYGYSAGLRERLEAVSSSYVDDILGVKSSTTGINVVVRRLFNEGRLPTPEYIRMRLDRSLELDFIHIENIEALKARHLAESRLKYERARHPRPDELDDDFNAIDEFVRRLQARGGQVVFVRMPSSGGLRALEDQYHPKAEYWDRFAAMSSGICIDSLELVGACELKCLDDSHLCYRDAVRFTRTFVDELVKRGVVKN